MGGVHRGSMDNGNTWSRSHNCDLGHPEQLGGLQLVSVMDDGGGMDHGSVHNWRGHNHVVTDHTGIHDRNRHEHHDSNDLHQRNVNFS